MKKILAMLVAVAFLAIGSVVIADNGPETVTLEGGKMGQITFPHTAHQAKVEDCTTCHHKGVDAGKCTSCHGVDAAAPKAKDAFHKQCKGCHKEMGGPTSCKDCHKK